MANFLRDESKFQSNSPETKGELHREGRNDWIFMCILDVDVIV